MSELDFTWGAILFAALVASVVAFIKFKKLNSRYPENDEMTKRMTEKAASISWSFSLLMWVIIVTCINANYFPVQPTLNIGVIAMLVTYWLARLYFHIIGINDEK